MADRAVARCFARAAATYDAVTTTQRRAAAYLQQLLCDADPATGVALDLGCATAPAAPALQKSFPDHAWLGIDMALPMLHQARTLQRTSPHYRPVCADAAQLPFANASIALTFSAFALQWLPPTTALAEQARVLKPGGLLAMTVPLAGSLAELATSWQQVDAAARPNPLPTIDAWRQAAEEACLEVAHWQQQCLVEYAPDALTLLRRIKASGAQHRTDGATPIGSRRRFAALARAYEPLRRPQGLPLSWQVGYLLCRRPA